MRIQRLSPTKAASEFTITLGVSTHFFAFSRKFFPPWERFGEWHACNMLIFKDLIFGIFFRVNGYKTRNPYQYEIDLYNYLPDHPP